jgi:predicted alpha/beta superfamily hydrolase
MITTQFIGTFRKQHLSRSAFGVFSGILLILSNASSVLAQASETHISANPKHYTQFPSAFVNARNIDVWLPPSYAASPTKHFPVLYMHDGQNLFDTATSYSNVAWGMDQAMLRLMKSGSAREAIIVGVWNTPKRYAEYMPQKAVRGGNLSDVQYLHGTSGSIISDQYLKFLVSEVKPFIDSTYRTLSNRENTLVMGSSMGGLISLYALCEYPNVFGGAGCVSTHWPAGNGIVIEYCKSHLPDAKTHKIYFDYGTKTLDSLYEPYQKKMDIVMKRAGYNANKNWITKKFDGADHSETSWSKRVEVPLRFLLRK